MEAYTGFAEVYDLFMEDVPYEAWKDFLVELLRQEGIMGGLVCELGCGTGKMTRLLAQSGYDMIGIDASDEMLSIAKAKESEGILYLAQDMREFELYGTVRAVVSVCDSMNYLLEEEDLLQVFRLADNYLDPGGVFIFDLNTEYKFKEILAQNSFGETRQNSAYIWENYYDEEEKINEFYMNFFIKQSDGNYQRKEEYHYEKAYNIATIKSLLEQSGLELSAIYDAYTFEPAKPDSQRIYIVAREVQKIGNCDVLTGGITK